MASQTGIRVCFRLDDPHACSDHSLERAIFETFDRYQIPLCVGVVPYRIAGREAQTFGASRDAMPHIAEGIESGFIELAQHGYAHLPANSDMDSRLSEFVGVKESTQRDLIAAGRRQLEEGFDTSIQGFVPPWNSYDQTTVRVLEDLGFRYLSAGIASPTYPRNPGRSIRTVAVPATCSLARLDRAVEQAVRYRTATPAIVCVFHPDEFEEFRDPPSPGEPPASTNLQQLAAKLGELSATPGLSFCSVSSLAEAIRTNRFPMHVTDMWWFRQIPSQYHYRYPQLILLNDQLRLMLGSRSSN